MRIKKEDFEKMTASILDAETRARSAESELKGYQDTFNEANDYFRAIATAMRRLELPPISTMSRLDIMQTYQTSAPVMGVVNYIADNVGEVMRFLELTRNGEQVENHWVLDLLKRPNDRFTQRKFGTAWALNRLLFGDAWVFAPMVMGKDKKVKEMYVIPSHRIAIREGKVQPMEGIQIQGFRPQNVDPDRFFESFDYNLDDTSLFGTSKIVAAAAYLNVMDKGIRRQDTALQNGGVNNVITPAKDSMGIMPKDADDVEKTFNASRNIGKTLALRIPVEVHELGNKVIDLEILSSHKEAVTALCFVYKIPVDLYYGQSKYENAKEAKKAIYEQMAIPMANEFGEDLLHYLKLDIQGYELKVNADLIDVLKDNATDVLQNLNLMYATLNERREAYGYEPIEEDWANQPIVPMGVSFGNESDYDIVEEPVKPKKDGND